MHIKSHAGKLFIATPFFFPDAMHAYMQVGAKVDRPAEDAPATEAVAEGGDTWDS